MSSSFSDPLDQFGGDSLGDGYLGTEPFPNFGSAAADSPRPIYAEGEFAYDPVYFSSETNGDGPILPPPTEMEPEEGYAMREWRRQNATRLEEKENRERELLSHIIVEADVYKVAFNQKGLLTCETKKAANREKEKIFIASQEKFHADADKDYWKSIAELIPNEVPAMEKRKGKKDQDKKPSVAVVQGPKPGKPTDLARMRQILIKLNHNTPAHLKPCPPSAPDAKTNANATALKAVAVA